jgi:multidrug resistance efflux pump
MKKTNKSKKLYWIIGIVVVVLVAGGFGLRYWLTHRSSKATSIQTAKVTIGNISTTLSGSGTVQSGQSSTLSWGTSGTVATVKVSVGQQVKAGDVLATLDPTTLSTDIIQAQADLIDAQTAYDDLVKPQPLKIAQAEADLKTAQDNLAALEDPTDLAIAQAQAAVTDAQTALDNLKNPTELAIAQADTNLTDAQTALDNLLNPDALTVSNAQTAVLTAKSTLDDAQAAVDRLAYSRGTTQQIDAANAAYVLAQSEVDRLQKVYDQTRGDPSTDPVKAQALSALNTAMVKRDKALANLNWYKSPWSASEILDKQTALAVAKAAYADAQKTLDNLNNPSELDVALAKAKVSDAQNAMDTLKNPTAVDIALAEAKVSDAQKALDTLKNPTAVDIELAKQKVADAQDTLDTLKNGASESDLIVAKSKITLAEATLAKSQITAPFSGTVTNVETLVGDVVSSGKSAFQIDDLSHLYVNLSISEVDISNIQVGQKATLTFDAISNNEYNGVVTQVVLAATVSQGVVNYPVTVEITDSDPSVLSGMTASVNGGQKTVTVLFQGQQIQVPVTVGLVGDSYTELTGNTLKEGDVVVVSTTTGTTASTSSINRFQGGPGEFGGGAIFVGP